MQLRKNRNRAASRNESANMSLLSSFSHKVALKNALLSDDSDVDKRIRIMKSFKRILQNDNKTAAYNSQQKFKSIQAERHLSRIRKMSDSPKKPLSLPLPRVGGLPKSRNPEILHQSNGLQAVEGGLHNFSTFTAQFKMTKIGSSVAESQNTETTTFIAAQNSFDLSFESPKKSK